MKAAARFAASTPALRRTTGTLSVAVPGGASRAARNEEMSTSDSSAMIAPCHRTSSCAPAGELSSVIATASRPVSARPTDAASRTVALSMTTRGSAPKW